jgi:heat shock protein HslJ
MLATFLLALATPLQAAGLVGSEWRPVRIGDTEIAKDADIFVRFEADGKLKGHGGCDGFFGYYKITGGDLEIGPIGAIHMACPELIMDRELAFTKTLQEAKSFKRERIKLELLRKGGAVIMELAQRDAD